MRNTELVSVETSLQVQQKKRKGIDLKFWDIPVRLLGLLFAGAMPISGMAPFGLSFLTLDRKFSLKSVINLIFVSVGYLLLFDFELALRYISACVIFETVLFVIERNEKPSLYFVAIVSAAALFLCEFGVLMWTGFTVAGLILIICDTMLMAVGVMVFDRSRDVLLENKFLSRSLLTDEKISLCIMAGVILLSTKSITVLDTFNISNFLACVLIGVVSLSRHGLTHGAVAGICSGIILGIGGLFPEFVAVLTICGLLCGVSAQFGRKVVCLCLGVCGLGIMLYMGIPGGQTHIPNIYELVLAAAVVYFLPRKAIIIGEKVTDFNVDNSDDTERFRMYVTEKLMCISDSFYDISKTFDSMSDKQTGMDMSDISLLFDTAADRVCKNCERANFCWKKDFNATYAAMFKFLEIMERKGSLQLSDVPKCFSDKCVHLLPLITEINRLFEIYKINRTWKNKLQENRELTSEQFKGISEIIKNAASEICGEKSFDIRSADEIKEVLNDMGISAQRVNVVCDKNGKYMVEISVLDCDDFSVCQKRIKPVIKKVLGINVAVPYNECDTSDSGKCCIRFCQVEGFDPSIGVASLSSNGESGDKHYTNYLSGGKLAVTISDGMGTGHKAAIQSDAIVKLLGSFLEAGFDKTIAVKLVNSVMVMKSARDAFATVDMCVIDLYTGEIEFIKNGAEASYIKHTEYTETVRAASLPIGIVSIGDIETFARTLENGSMVVMTSDGVISAAEDNWIRELVEVIDMEIPPKELAQIILDEAVKRNAENGIENDDMTVICVKLSDRRVRAEQKHVPKAAVM